MHNQKQEFSLLAVLLLHETTIFQDKIAPRLLNNAYMRLALAPAV